MFPLKIINSETDVIRQSIAEFQPKSTMQSDALADLDGAMRDAVKLKFLDKLAHTRSAQGVRADPAEAR